MINDFQLRSDITYHLFSSAYSRFKLVWLKNIYRDVYIEFILIKIVDL